jgi:hypothetical protein
MPSNSNAAWTMKPAFRFFDLALGGSCSESLFVSVIYDDPWIRMEFIAINEWKNWKGCSWITSADAKRLEAGTLYKPPITV